MTSSIESSSIPVLASLYRQYASMSFVDDVRTSLIPCCLLITISVCVWWTFKHMRMRWYINAFDGPRAYFLFGNAHQFKIDSRDWLDQGMGCSMIYTRLFRTWCFMVPYLVICGAEWAEAVLGSNKHNQKSHDYTLMKPFLGNGLLTSPADKWRNRRKLLTPTFHYDILKDFIPIFNKQAKNLIAILSTKGDDRSFDAYPLVTRCTLAVICETSLGHDINAQGREQDSEYVSAIYSVNDIIHRRQKEPWFWPDCAFYTIGRGREHDRCLKIVHTFSEKIIQNRYTILSRGGEEEGVKEFNNNDEYAFGSIQKKRLTFLDLMIKMVMQEQLTLGDVRDEVNTFMFEGHDTTSANISWALHLIGCHPDIQAKICDEVDSIFGDDDRDVEFEDLRQLTYLECCLKESLRLFPSVPMFGRLVKEGFMLDGKYVPRDTQILVNPYAIHRDPKHWPDPELFIPERFLPGNCIGRHPFAYIPFSAGTRNCIGQRFALMEEKTILSWIFRYFKIESVQRRDQVRSKSELIMRPEHGVLLRLKTRR